METARTWFDGWKYVFICGEENRGDHDEICFLIPIEILHRGNVTRRGIVVIETRDRRSRSDRFNRGVTVVESENESFYHFAPVASFGLGYFPPIEERSFVFKIQLFVDHFSVSFFSLPLFFVYRIHGCNIIDRNIHRRLKRNNIYTKSCWSFIFSKLKTSIPCLGKVGYPVESRGMKNKFPNSIFLHILRSDLYLFVSIGYKKFPVKQRINKLL